LRYGSGNQRLVGLPYVFPFKHGKAREFFEVTVPAEREVPKVSFGAAAQ